VPSLADPQQKVKRVLLYEKIDYHI
jgi:hypothetical protein